MMSWLHEQLRAKARRFIAERRIVGRMLAVFPDDTFLVSYMKSGNTWLRFLLANLLSSGEPVTFLEMEDRIPMIYDCPDAALRRTPRPRIIASHECFDPRYKKLIYIVRDPRDVVISSYYHHLRLRHIPEGYPMDSFVPRWLAETQWSDGAPRFGSWREHVLSWTATRGNDPGFLLLRYEDMLQDSQRELGRVARFMRIDASPEELARAIEHSSVERMRRLEKRQHETWGMTKGTRADVAFVRNATSGGWQSTLTESSVRQIESACGAVMKSFGYRLSAKAPTISSPAPVAGILSRGVFGT